MTDDQFNALQAQLTQINDKLVEHDHRFDEQDKTIQTLYEHVEERAEALTRDMRLDKLNIKSQSTKTDLKLAELRRSTDKMVELLDGIADRLDIDDTERVALSSQVTRHGDWIKEAAPVVGVKYAPGT